jgi:hypothetical protein
MPTCTSTGKPNTWNVKVGPWIVGQLNRTPAGFTFTEARAMDVFGNTIYSTAEEIRTAIASWYVGQEELACD